MSRIIHLVWLLSFSLLAFGQVPTPKLSCQIASDKQVYKVGEDPLIAIRIINNADSAIQLVKVLDGSESLMRFPYLYYEVYRLSGSTSQEIPPFPMGRCGNMDDIRAADFVTVKPGQTFDPLANQDYVYTSGVSLRGWFQKKGHYSIVFHYLTNQPDFKQWRGDLIGRLYGDSPRAIAARQAANKKLLALFAKVPKVDLVSNKLFIDFE